MLTRAEKEQKLRRLNREYERTKRELQQAQADKTANYAGRFPFHAIEARNRCARLETVLRDIEDDIDRLERKKCVEDYPEVLPDDEILDVLPAD